MTPLERATFEDEIAAEIGRVKDDLNRGRLSFWQAPDALRAIAERIEEHLTAPDPLT